MRLPAPNKKMSKKELIAARRDLLITGIITTILFPPAGILLLIALKRINRMIDEAED